MRKAEFLIPFPQLVEAYRAADYTETVNCFRILENFLIPLRDIDEIDKAVKVQPIAVDDINEKVDVLKSTANALFDEVENKFREMQLAESAVVYVNRDRNHQDDVHQQLCVLEDGFYHGDFVKVYHDANALFKRMHVEDAGNANG